MQYEEKGTAVREPNKLPQDGWQRSRHARRKLYILTWSLHDSYGDACRAVKQEVAVSAVPTGAARILLEAKQTRPLRAGAD